MPLNSNYKVNGARIAVFVLNKCIIAMDAIFIYMLIDDVDLVVDGSESNVTP